MKGDGEIGSVIMVLMWMKVVVGGAGAREDVLAVMNVEF